MKTVLSRSVALVAVTLLPALAGGCATSSKITQAGGSHELASGAAPGLLPSSTRIRVLAPEVAYEHALTEAPLAASAFGGAGLEAALVAKALSSLPSKGLVRAAYYADDAELTVEQKALAERVGMLASRLLRAHPDPQALALLEGLAETDAPVAVLAHYVRVKVGPRGTWDPNTGAITSSASSSMFRAALFDCQTGRRLWDNLVLLRRLPDPDSRDFDKVIQLLYSNLNP